MACKSEKLKKIHLKDLNDLLICSLCNGYLIDATTLVDCYHVFCRGCILRYFENCKNGCPLCNTVYKKKGQMAFRPDVQIQSIVYKVVPGLYAKEMQRREDFYRSTGVRASSSCSDDSVLERERDLIHHQEALMSSDATDGGGGGAGDNNANKLQFFGPEDLISLSLEYYQSHLDDTPLDDGKIKSVSFPSNCIADVDTKSEIVLLSNGDVKQTHKVNNNGSSKSVNKAGCMMSGSDSSDVIVATVKSDSQACAADKRFLQCPAAVCMKLLQKFVRMKFALTANHRVDIIYRGEVLPTHFSLMDVAYTFKWKRLKPMRFFYRIFTPMKIQPIKIINTALITGEKQLQIVPATIRTDTTIPNTIPNIKKPSPPLSPIKQQQESSEEKERLLANLQLQSKNKVQTTTTTTVPENKKTTAQDCVFEYEEPDKEEIKRFAEKRDREWAMMENNKKLMDDGDYHHFSKKRKKNKHSKSEFVYKKRKLHAEITNKAEELKLKVKLTPAHNGHKHKHHKSNNSSSQEICTNNSSKEKLLQMRQVRHKHQVSSEDKNIQTSHPSEEAKTKPEMVAKSDTGSKIETNGSTETTKSDSVKTLRSDFPAKSMKEWGTKVATVQIERNEQTEQQAKKTFFKSFQTYAEKYQKNIQEKKTEMGKVVRPPTTLPQPHQSQLERKIANLQQRCTVEAKSPPKYPPGCTVSKIETPSSSNQQKRKLDEEVKMQEKRPSLEITLINPQQGGDVIKPATPPVVVMNKRPPPATIPLDRIKKSITLKSGISIIPKVAAECNNKCDNIGALDLSKPNTTIKSSNNNNNMEKSENKSSGVKSGGPNGYNNGGGKNINMSNLQMLSKVAAEHPKAANNNNNNVAMKQIPNLQTLKIPTVLPQRTVPNLDKLPKLTEINKAQFRMSHHNSAQIRNLRPNQNQNIRNIPNPSLLVRQQNQNRLNSMNSTGSGNSVSKEDVKATPPPPLPLSVSDDSSNKSKVPVAAVDVVNTNNSGKMVGEVSKEVVA